MIVYQVYITKNNKEEILEQGVDSIRARKVMQYALSEGVCSYIKTYESEIAPLIITAMIPGIDYEIA